MYWELVSPSANIITCMQLLKRMILEASDGRNPVHLQSAEPVIAWICLDATLILDVDSGARDGARFAAYNFTAQAKLWAIILHWNFAGVSQK